MQLKTVHLLRLRDDWQVVKGLWRVALILILIVLFSRRPRKSFRVRVLNLGSLTPDLYLCLNPHLFLCFLHGSYVSAYECVWMCVLSKSTYGRRKFSGFGVNIGSWIYTFLAHTVLTFFVLTFLLLKVLSFSLSAAFCYRRLELWTLYGSSGFAATFGLELHPHHVGEGHQARCGE